MKEENGNSDIIQKNEPIYKSTKSSTDFHIINIKENLFKNKLRIEDILENDEYINDLRENPNSQFKEVITLENIISLISFCFKSNSNKYSQKELRYSYYSCQILCSPCVLLFSKSIQNIKQLNDLKKNKSIESDSEKINKANSLILSEKEDDKNKLITSEESIIINSLNDEIIDQMNQIGNNMDYTDIYYNEFSQILNEYENEINEKYVDLYKIQKTETEIQRQALSKKQITLYDKVDKKIINKILNKIFEILDFKNEEQNETYMGYFQKIVNYLIINEPDIIIEYLFKENASIITNLYSHLNKGAIQIIFENLLNLLSEKEDKDKYNNIDNSKYTQIIQQLIQKLEEDNKNNKFDRAEYICELILKKL